MAEIEQTKVCPLCAETIKAAAKVCPHCRKSQRHWAFMTRYDFFAIAFPLILIVTFFVFNKAFYHRRDFALDRDKIQVTEFHFAFDKSRYETNVVMLGTLTNESDYSWDIGHFEIRYLNNMGKVLDIEDDAYGNDFTVLPYSDHSFSLDLYERKSLPQYAVCEVKVVSADDPRAPFNLFGN
jgi:hypothetical protein